MFTGLGNFPSDFNRNLKISPEFPREFSFHLQPKFTRGFPPSTTTIPRDSLRNLQDFARWVHTDTCGLTLGVHVCLRNAEIEITNYLTIIF